MSLKTSLISHFLNSSNMSCNFTYNELHCVAVWQPPRPSISHLQAISDRQTLLVSWLVNQSGLVGGIYEIQICRTENRTVIYNVSTAVWIPCCLKALYSCIPVILQYPTFSSIYSGDGVDNHKLLLESCTISPLFLLIQRNVSVFWADSDEYTWTWTSELPLECVDHSVRIRHFFNQSVPSPWSDWKTNYGETMLLYSDSQSPKHIKLNQIHREQGSLSCFTDKITTSNKHKRLFSQQERGSICFIFPCTDLDIGVAQQFQGLLQSLQLSVAMHIIAKAWPSQAWMGDIFIVYHLWRQCNIFSFCFNDA